MPTFACSGCEKSIRVPDQYIGKRVRCPACEIPQRVPNPAATPMVDLSLLDADESVSTSRRLRQVLIGCGACQKTVRLPESRMGTVTACPRCSTPLQFDRFDLSKAKGDLIDMTHLELDPGDPLADTGGFGSTMGGSSVSLSGSAAGRSASGASGSFAGAGLGGQSSDSQTQMRELRELNDAKHRGEISAEEYRRRKAEIYSGKTLALQAMSRSADGSGGSRPVLKANQARSLPGPAIAAIAVAAIAALSLTAYGVFFNESDPAVTDSSSPAAEGRPAGLEDDTVAQASPIPTTGVAESLFQTPEDQVEGDALTTTTEDSQESTQVSDKDQGESSQAVVLANTSDTGAPDASVQQSIPGDDASELLAGVEGAETPAIDVAQPEIPAPPVAMKISQWPVEWIDYQPSSNQAMTEACDVMKRILLRDEDALIGVDVGPAAENLDDVNYRQYRREMQAILLRYGENEGIMDRLIIRDSEETFLIKGLECHGFHISMRGRSSDRATIISGVQDGRAVSYWFAGSRLAYPAFIDTIGLAEFAPAN